MVQIQRIFNLLFIFVIGGVLSGGYLYQFIKNEDPCPLCLLQRLGMIGIATALLFNLRFGVKVQHYGLAILSALLGRTVSLRQIGYHLCPEFPAFGEPVLGLDLYIWALMVFSSSLFACGALLILYGYSKELHYPPTWGSLEKAAFLFIASLTLANIFTALLECGLSPC